MVATRADDPEILAQVKQLLIPYKRALGGLKGGKGISYQTNTQMFDPVYNIHWPVLVSVKVGADEEFDLIDLLGSTLDGIAHEFGHRFSKAVGKDCTELMIR